MPLVATRGAASAQGFGEFARVTPPIYIEDVFSTYLYTGTGSSQTITNGIDLSGKGGLVWVKSRSVNNNCLVDTVRGASNTLQSDLTTANVFASTVTAFSSSGFTVGTSGLVSNSNSYASWTFREQAKFFDVVTYTGNGNNSRQIAHNLGSSPGFVIIKRTDAASDWYTFHRSITSNQYPRLNGTDQDPNYSAVGNPSLGGAVNSTNLVFASAGTTTTVNINNATYVAYLFAHNAGGFGLTGSDNVISCGSFTTDGSGNATVTLDWEPQFILTKRTDASTSDADWNIFDVMRGIPVTGNRRILKPNNANAESGAGFGVRVTSTGMTYDGGAASATYIYIAIRRGPMKTPTSGTSVYSGTARRGTGAAATITSGFVTDMVLSRSRIYAGLDWGAWDRLRGASPFLSTNGSQAEATSSTAVTGFDTNSGTIVGTDANALINNNNASFYDYITYQLARAPGFLDVVCYTGTTADNTQTHNLSAVPELIIIKRRNAAQSWAVFNSFTSTQLTRSFLNFDSPATTYLYTDNTGIKQQPTSTQFVLNGANTFVNVNAGTYVAYLFATVAGVSKVGSYTGTGALQTINCGFAAGARFVLIKRTDSTGDWWVYDSARGISSGNDPYLFLNSTAAEVTNTNYVDTTSVGFQVTAAAPAGLNANGGTYIFLAIS